MTPFTSKVCIQKFLITCIAHKLHWQLEDLIGCCEWGFLFSEAIKLPILSWVPVYSWPVSHKMHVWYLLRVAQWFWGQETEMATPEPSLDSSVASDRSTWPCVLVLMMKFPNTSNVQLLGWFWTDFLSGLILTGCCGNSACCRTDTEETQIFCVEMKLTDIRRSDTNTATVHSCSASTDSDDSDVRTENYIRKMEGYWLASTMYGAS